MQTWIIEFSVIPPEERIDQWGVMTHLEVSEDALPGKARLWARRCHGMSWMEDDPNAGTRAGEPIHILWELAKPILDKVRNTQVLMASPGAFGFHPTKYRLKISLGFNSSEFSWAGKAPSEWAALGEVAETLAALGREHAREA